MECQPEPARGAHQFPSKPTPGLAITPASERIRLSVRSCFHQARASRAQGRSQGQLFFAGRLARASRRFPTLAQAMRQYECNSTQENQQSWTKFGDQLLLHWNQHVYVEVSLSRASVVAGI